ncbi:MAG: hypothetical protein L0Z73_12840 [Gammaproteobacteria bacterium]|nr:hypothetical protein [Gammaproteobacteria bacterium]
MTDLVIRIVELVTGLLLIVVSLMLNTHYANQTLLLLPLIALPIIFSGMFDWHPAKELGLLLAEAGKRFSLASIIKPHVNSP